MLNLSQYSATSCCKYRMFCFMVNLLSPKRIHEGSEITTCVLSASMSFLMPPTSIALAKGNADILHLCAVASVAYGPWPTKSHKFNHIPNIQAYTRTRRPRSHITYRAIISNPILKPTGLHLCRPRRSTYESNAAAKEKQFRPDQSWMEGRQRVKLGGKGAPPWWCKRSPTWGRSTWSGDRPAS